MPRKFAAMPFAIWDNQAFRALSPAERDAWHFLYGQPDLSAAGVLALTVGRWQHMLGLDDVEDLRSALRGLADKGFILIDHTTQELLIRRFVALDKLWRQPRMLGVSLREARHIHSPALRQAYGADLVEILLDPATAAEAALKFGPEFRAAAFTFAGMPEPAPTPLGPPPPAPPREPLDDPLATPTGTPSAGDRPPPGSPPPAPPGEGTGEGAGAGAPALRTPLTPLPAGESASPTPAAPMRSCTKHRRWRRSCVECGKVNSAKPPCPDHQGGPRIRLNAAGQPYRCPDCHDDPVHVPYHLAVVAGGG